jgi:hypothetical protein
VIRTIKRFRRGILAAPALLVLPLILSGCVVITNESATQTEVIGPVELTTEACYSDDYATFFGGVPIPSGPCPNGNSGLPVYAVSFAALIGYRVPDATVAPATIQGTGADALTFAPDPTYTAELQRLLPAPGGQRWVGYRSDVIALGGPGGGFTAAARFGLAPAADGGPFQGPFTYRTVVGFTSTTGGEPVDCGTSATAANPGGSPATPQDICVDSPDAAALPTNSPVATRDLGIVAGTPVGAAVGAEGDAPFTAKFAGTSDPAASFTLSASTNVPGGTATPSQPTLVPGTDSATPLTVRVAVPLDTGPGNYSVTLRAALANGQVRTRTATFPVRLGAPVVMTRPAITGTPTVGQPLTCSLGVWHNSTPRFAIQWLLDDRPIANAVYPGHIVRGAEAGHRLTCAITAINDAGRATSVTDPVTIGRGAAPSLHLAGVPEGCAPARFFPHAIARSLTPVARMRIFLDGRALAPVSADPAALGAQAGPLPIRGIVTARVLTAGLRPGIHTVRATATNAGGTSTVSARAWRCARR